MAENVTLEAYEKLLANVDLFREQYEIFDSDVMRSIEIFNSDVLRAGAPFFQQKMGEEYAGYLSHLRHRIYGTTRTLAENLSARYRTWCETLEQTPSSFHLSFRPYWNPDLAGNRPGKTALRDARQALDACNAVRSHLISSYAILMRAYARLRMAANEARDGILVQDISRVEGWIKTIGEGVRQAEGPYKVIVRALELLAKKLD